MSKRPWMKFYPSDWLADVPLKSCSAAARGLWIDMVAIMHSATSPGYLVVNDRPMTDATLAGQTGIPVGDVIRSLAELESAGVFSRRDDGAIYSRRMIRDAEKAARDKANGSRGGNPHLIRSDRGLSPNGDKAHWPLASGLSKEGAEVQDEVEAASYDAEAPFGRDGLH